MKRTNKQVGTWAETTVRNHLAIWWPEVRRCAPAGAKDCGDLDGIPGLCVQVKNQRAMALSAWVDEARQQAANAGKPFFAVIHRRRQKAADEWYVTMPLYVFADIYRQASSIPVNDLT